MHYSFKTNAENPPDIVRKDFPNAKTAPVSKLQKKKKLINEITLSLIDKIAPGIELRYIIFPR